MVATAWLDVHDGLVNGMRARSGYQAANATGAFVPVYDTVETSLTSDLPPKCLTIGWIGDPDDIPSSPGDTSLEVATLGTTHARQEHGVIRCAAHVSYGDAVVGSAAAAAGTIGAAMREAFGITNDVDAFLRADPTAGVGATYKECVAIIGRVEALPWLNEGHKVRIEFTVEYSARV